MTELTPQQKHQEVLEHIQSYMEILLSNPEAKKLLLSDLYDAVTYMNALTLKIHKKLVLEGEKPNTSPEAVEQGKQSKAKLSTFQKNVDNQPTKEQFLKNTASDAGLIILGTNLFGQWKQNQTNNSKLPAAERVELETPAFCRKLQAMLNSVAQSRELNKLTEELVTTNSQELSAKDFLNFKYQLIEDTKQALKDAVAILDALGDDEQDGKANTKAALKVVEAISKNKEEYVATADNAQITAIAKTALSTYRANIEVNSTDIVAKGLTPLPLHVPKSLNKVIESPIFKARQEAAKEPKKEIPSVPAPVPVPPATDEESKTKKQPAPPPTPKPLIPGLLSEGTSAVDLPKVANSKIALPKFV